MTKGQSNTLVRVFVVSYLAYGGGVMSQTPTTSPTQSPSTSKSPSSKPSRMPSSSPSSKPSLSKMPSGSPSAKPSHSAMPSSIPSSKPSQSPSAKPSMVPSESPSAQPSHSVIPSSSPSSKPSQSPSAKPSMVPSERPSAKPSESPSDMPSMVPSESPSSKPSESPSGTPSKIPSESPSAKPSESPSDAPSKMPSESPSRTPSMMPSGSPSAFPSSSPSGMPSSSPSCAPSAAPTPAPSMHLFYPDWEGDDLSCIADGNEPVYMINNPTAYLYSSLAACCLKHYGYRYEECAGLAGADCATDLWYPDWNGANEMCIRDGNQPTYMRSNPVGHLFESRAECCQTHYLYDYDTCVGAAAGNSGGMYFPDWEGDNDKCLNDGNAPSYMVDNPTSWMHDTVESCCAKYYEWMHNECILNSGGSVPSSSSTAGMYYPNWGGSSHVCVNDSAQPEYMTSNPSAWMFDTLEACCKKNYQWNYAECMGTSSTGTNKWYVDYGNKACAQDCTGPAPCGGLASEDVNKYDTSAECCAEKVWWVSATACEAESEGTTPAGGQQWYVDWKSAACVQDCVGASPCGGFAEKWDTLYSTKSTCCKTRLPWNPKCDA